MKVSHYLSASFYMWRMRALLVLQELVRLPVYQRPPIFTMVRAEPLRLFGAVTREICDRPDCSCKTTLVSKPLTWPLTMVRGGSLRGPPLSWQWAVGSFSSSYKSRRPPDDIEWTFKPLTLLIEFWL